MLVCHWGSTSEQAACVAGRTISHRRKKTYLVRRLQALPASGLTLYHAVKANRYICEKSECSVDTFPEQFAEIADPDARLTHRLKDLIVQHGLDARANALARSLRSIGIRVSRETILRLIKARGAVAVQQNLERKDVRVLSVDDINLRKGQPSTACSVFIDAETPRPLVIGPGATQAVAEKVMRQYPGVEMVSRDRGSAYSAAANALGNPQVADGFHLVQNLPQTVQESLQQILGSDGFVRTGANWIRVVNEAADSAGESPSAEVGADQGKDLLVVSGPATLTETDREQRIRLAGLTPHQATKYRQTLSVLELTESGWRGVEIAKRLACTPAQVRQYRKQAPDTIQSVEQKIDQFYGRCAEGRRPLPSGAQARPSSESIVAPYRDIVVRLLEAGAKHLAIPKQIAQEGFTGSRNAVSQYVTKYAQEHDAVYQGNLPSNAGKDDEIPPRPEPIGVERTSTTTIYRHLLHLAASQRDANQATPTGASLPMPMALRTRNRPRPNQKLNYNPKLNHNPKLNPGKITPSMRMQLPRLCMTPSPKPPRGPKENSRRRRGTICFRSPPRCWSPGRWPS